MRLLGTIALAGTFLSTAALQAQSLAEHAAAAAGATIGTAGGKSLSNGITKVLGDTSEETKKAANQGSVKKETPSAAATPSVPAASAPAAGPGPAPATASADAQPSGRLPERLIGSSRRRRAAPREKQQPTFASATPAAINPVAPPVIAEPPLPKEPTAEDVANIQVGASEKDVLAALGVPASHVIIPDDDGHLRETCQYWAKGAPVGTIRLDNGYVVKVEANKF